MGFPLLSALFTALDKRFGSDRVEVRHFLMETEKSLPAPAMRIAVLSDLHSRTLGSLADTIKAQQPDYICFCGDLIKCDIDEEFLSVGPSLLHALSKIAPTYMVPGNHEALCPEPIRLSEMIRECGVTLLEDQKAGPFYGMITSARPLNAKEKQALLERLWAMQQDASPDEFKILLAHRPAEMDVFEQSGFDLVFCGHVHGGFMRLPGRGYQNNGVGLLGPETGLFPKYHSGLYVSERPESATRMLVSRGLGGPRIGIAPEVAMVEIRQTNKGRR